MKLIVLIVRNEHHPDESWVETAWDEYMLDADATPYFNAVKKAVAKYGHENVGEIEVVVPDGSLGKAFPPVPKVAGEVVKGGPCEQDEEAE